MVAYILLTPLRILVASVLYPLAVFGSAYPFVLLTFGFLVEVTRLIKSRKEEISFRPSAWIWSIPVLCYCLATSALFFHIVAAHTTVPGFHSIDTLILLLSSGLFETFGLPGLFQLVFVSSNAPAVTYNMLTNRIAAGRDGAPQRRLA
jgi:hypothetical protein